MSMAMACLEEMDRINVLEHVNRLGNVLADGLRSTAEDAGFSAIVSGPAAIPFLTFAGDPDMYLNQAFCARMARNRRVGYPSESSTATPRPSTSATAVLVRSWKGLTKLFT